MFSRAKSREVGIILVPAVRDCSGSRDFAFPEQGKLGEQSQTPLFPRAHADPALKDFLLITFLSARGRVESSCLELFGGGQGVCSPVWLGTGHGPAAAPRSSHVLSHCHRPGCAPLGSCPTSLQSGLLRGLSLLFRWPRWRHIRGLGPVGALTLKKSQELRSLRPQASHGRMLILAVLGRG